MSIKSWGSGGMRGACPKGGGGGGDERLAVFWQIRKPKFEHRRMGLRYSISTLRTEIYKA